MATVGAATAGDAGGSGGTADAGLGGAGKAAYDSTHGAVLTVDQVMALALDAGGDRPGGRELVATAVAVAFAESGGRTDAVYTNADQWHSRDRGLWQINDHWHAEVTDAMAFDPRQNAHAAFRISGGWSFFTAWTTYRDGAYRRFLPPAREAYDALHAGGPSALAAALASIGGAMLDAGGAAAGVVGGAASGVLSVGEFLGKLGDRKTWMRVVQVVGGLGAVALGLVLLERDLVPTAVATAVDPAAAAIKAATKAANRAGGHATAVAPGAAKEVGKAAATGAAASGVTKVATAGAKSVAAAAA